MVDTAVSGRMPAPLWRSYGAMLAGFAIATLLVLALLNLPFATDYVGQDNDDIMRLVQVRDLLAGQNWFDLTQYRLGLEGGTLMHWSRLVDLPIALLIRAFGLVAEPLAAERLALAAWPSILAVALLAVMGLAGRRIGGARTMNLAFALTAILIVTGNRFLPGSIDHHNLQFVLIATMAAMLADRQSRPSSYAVAGIAASVAIAIGAETTPLVVAVCGVVAVTWAIEGRRFAPAASAFALALTLSISVVFFATVPPRFYATVTCDSLSIGFYGLASIGGLALLVSVLVAGRLGIAGRFALLGLDAAIVGAAALVLAPECLGSPLANLDPMLVDLWLNGVEEAQSVLSELRREPGGVGGFYAVGLFAITVCAVRVFRGDDRRLHAMLLPLLVVAWGIALVQVRGAVFANLLAILPLSLLIIQLRRNANREPENLGAGFVFAVAVVAAVPNVWALGGTLIAEGTGGLANRMRTMVPTEATGPSTDCNSWNALSPLVSLPATTIAAPSDSGAAILRFTDHRVLTAPYHRNQGGMLTELHIGLARPDEAQALLRGAGVGVLAFCPSMPQTRQLTRMKPDGLYASLERGEHPSYLQPIEGSAASGMQFFKVVLSPE